MTIFYKNKYTAMAGSLLGVAMFASAYSLFLRPLHLYSGGFTGLAQMINTLFNFITRQSFSHIDLTGAILWAMNLPLFVLAYVSIGKGFLFTSILCVTVQSALLVVIPVPAAPIFSDSLTNIIVGGAISGYGVGLTLCCGGSGGGIDIVGVYGAKKFADFSVGKISIFINVFIYLYCAVVYNLETAVYSILFCILSCLVTDRVHAQNIKSSVLIVSRQPQVKELIINELQRGVTMWDARGGYTNDPSCVYMTVISKDEFPVLRKKIMALDSKAFITVQNHMGVYGNFIKRL